MPQAVADELFHEIADGAARESPLWADALLPEPERRAEPVFSALVPDPRFALGVETIYEGYLLHYGRARIFARATQQGDLKQQFERNKGSRKLSNARPAAAKMFAN